MGVTIFRQEFVCPISAARMFTALIVDSKNLIPKLLPQFIASVDVIQGNGGSGSIEQVNFTEGIILLLEYKNFINYYINFGIYSYLML